MEKSYYKWELIEIVNCRVRLMKNVNIVIIRECNISVVYMFKER